MAGFLFLILGFEKPSSKKRILASIDALRAKGHRVEAMPIPASPLKRVALIPVLRQHDVVVLQKKLFNAWQLSLLRRVSRNLVFDFDDAIMFHEIERGEPVRGKFFARFVRTVASCRGIVAGNTYLADFAKAVLGKDAVGKPRVIVLPTPVDTSSLTPASREERDGTVTIGWLGTKGNLVHLQQIQAPLREACLNNPGVSLKVVSDAKPGALDAPYAFKPWSQSEENGDLRSFDIGVMPLEDNLWTRGKGGYKLLQYMAAGAASVASPVGINREIIRHGNNGCLAQNDEEWATALNELIRDRSLRNRIGAEARATVEREFSLDTYSQRLCGFLESLL